LYLLSLTLPISNVMMLLVLDCHQQILKH